MPVREPRRAGRPLHQRKRAPATNSREGPRRPESGRRIAIQKASLCRTNRDLRNIRDWGCGNARPFRPCPSSGFPGELCRAHRIGWPVGSAPGVPPRGHARSPKLQRRRAGPAATRRRSRLLRTRRKPPPPADKPAARRAFPMRRNCFSRRLEARRRWSPRARYSAKGLTMLA